MQEGSAARAVRVLIADDVIHAVAGLAKLADYADLVDVVGLARQPEALFDEARLRAPDVILIQQGFGGTDTSVLVDELAASAPGSRLILVVEAGELDPAAGAAGLGVGAVVARDAGGEEWLAAIVDVAGPLKNRPAAQRDEAGVEPASDVSPAPAETDDSAALETPVAGVDGETMAPAAEAEAPPVAAEVAPTQPKRVRRATKTKAETFIVFSGKGGVGKSLVATNLAVALSADGGRVVIVDLDLQFGDVAVMLHVEAHPTAIDALAQQGEQVDSDFIEEVMATGPEGVRILLAPASPEFADLVTTANLRAILREMTKTFDYIVVDAPAHLEERTLEVIELADQIIVVTAFNITAVKDTKITLKLLQSLGIPKERIAVVLNQTRAKVNFPRSEVEDSLRFPVLTTLPFEPRVDDAIDGGRPIVIAEPKSEFTKQFRVLVDYLAPSGTEGIAAPAAARAKARPKANRRRFSLGRG